MPFRSIDYESIFFSLDFIYLFWFYFFSFFFFHFFLVPFGNNLGPMCLFQGLVGYFFLLDCAYVSVTKRLHTHTHTQKRKTFSNKFWILCQSNGVWFFDTFIWWNYQKPNDRLLFSFSCLLFFSLFEIYYHHFHDFHDRRIRIENIMFIFLFLFHDKIDRFLHRFQVKNCCRINLEYV